MAFESYNDLELLAHVIGWDSASKLYDNNLPELLYCAEAGEEYRAEKSKLVAMRELFARADLQELKALPDCTTSAKCKQFLQRKLAGERREMFGVLFLNNLNECLEFEILFQGSHNTVPVGRRVIVQRALELNATAIVVAHNHPGGSLCFSRQDKERTIELNEACKTVDITLLDHILVTVAGTLSMVENKLYPFGDK